MTDATTKVPQGVREDIGQPIPLPDAIAKSGILDWLNDVEFSTQFMTAEECVKELEAYDYDVLLELTSPRGAYDPNDDPTGYTVLRPTVTLVGLQWAVARERLMESLNAAREAREDS